MQDNEQMLSACRDLRAEKEREMRLVDMKRELKNQVHY